jgi:tRNA A37 threonylcarbamoyladenosine modification protein TsaB
LFSSVLEFDIKKKIKMNKLIIDVANKDIFLMIITNNGIYNVSYENSKINYEKLMILINNFLDTRNLKLNNISSLYVNGGPGSFAGIRNSIATVKAIHVSYKIDYYCYSFQDFINEKEMKYQDIPNLCDKFKVKKNLINTIYLS